MSLDVGSLNKRVFYVNLETQGTGVDNRNPNLIKEEATIQESYVFPLMEKTSDWLLNVERMTLNLAGISFFDGIKNAIVFYQTGAGATPQGIEDRINPIQGAAAPAAVQTAMWGFDLEESYSMHDFAANLNNMVQGDGVLGASRLDDRAPAGQTWLTDLIASGEVLAGGDGGVADFNSKNEGRFFHIREDGRLEFIFNMCSNWCVWLHPILASVMDTGTSALRPETIAGGGIEETRTIIGYTSIINRVDKLHSIVINATGLQTNSEYLAGGGKGNVITDFIYEGSFNTSTSYHKNEITSEYSWGAIPRDTLIYNSRKPRWVVMSGNSPVRKLIITAYWKNLHDAYLRSIPLSPHGKFTIKLGFYSRV